MITKECFGCGNVTAHQHLLAATLDAHPAIALLVGGADNTVLRERSEKTMAAEVFFRYYFDAHCRAAVSGALSKMRRHQPQTFGGTYEVSSRKAICGSRWP
jgi:hypothetical protein